MFPFKYPKSQKQTFVMQCAIFESCLTCMKDEHQAKLKGVHICEAKVKNKVHK